MSKITARTTTRALRTVEVLKPITDATVGTFFRPLHIGVVRGKLQITLRDIDGRTIIDELSREQSLDFAKQIKSYKG